VGGLPAHLLSYQGRTMTPKDPLGLEPTQLPWWLLVLFCGLGLVAGLAFIWLC